MFKGWVIELCLDCEIQVIRVDTLSEPPRPPGVSHEDAWRQTVDTFRYYAEYAQRHSIVVAWEFEPGFMLNKPIEIVGLVKEVDHPNFTVMFDFCHAHMCAAVGARRRPPRETLPGGAVELGQGLQGHIGLRVPRLDVVLPNSDWRGVCRWVISCTGFRPCFRPRQLVGRTWPKHFQRSC